MQCPKLQAETREQLAAKKDYFGSKGGGAEM